MNTKTKITTTIVAQLFRRSNQSIINWCKKGLIKHSRIMTGPRYFLIEDIEDFMLRNKISENMVNRKILDYCRSLGVEKCY